MRRSERTEHFHLFFFNARKLDKRRESLHPYALCFLLYASVKAAHTGAEPTDCVGE